MIKPTTVSSRGDEVNPDCCRAEIEEIEASECAPCSPSPSTSGPGVNVSGPPMAVASVAMLDNAATRPDGSGRAVGVLVLVR